MEKYNKTTILVDEEVEDIFQENSTGEHFQVNFRNNAPPAESPERNDYYWPKIYDFKKHHFEITIKPINTPYWRFGFRYSKSGLFPPNTGVRHSDKEIADIHICVGDMGENRKWFNAKKVSLQSYHVAHMYNHPTIVEDQYEGEEIILSAKWNERTSHVHYELKTNGTVLYYDGFELSSFNSCVFGAWSDFNEYTLAAYIKVVNR